MADDRTIQRLKRRKQGLNDPSNTFRKAYRDSAEAFDVIVNGNSLVPHKYSRIAQTLNSNGCPTTIEYYNDDNYEEVELTCEADAAGSLNGTYFILHTGGDRVKYVIWYNVDGGGTAPSVANATLIEVQIQTNDLAQVVALATKQQIETNLEYYFYVEQVVSKLRIFYNQGGETTSLTDVDTGFGIDVEQAGGTTVVAKIDITYNSKGTITAVKRY